METLEIENKKNRQVQRTANIYSKDTPLQKTKGAAHRNIKPGILYHGTLRLSAKGILNDESCYENGFCEEHSDEAIRINRTVAS